MRKVLLKRRYRKNPGKGGFYQIYISMHRNKSNEMLVWEGFGSDDPWNMFYKITATFSRQLVTLYVHEPHSNLLRELAEYRDGELYY